MLLLVLLGLAVLLGSNVQRAVRAEEERNSIKTLLEQLNSQVQAGERLITFQFVRPIAEGDNLWTVGDPSDESSLHISEIGENYLCLTETSAAAALTRCVPFTNIASISYLET